MPASLRRFPVVVLLALAACGDDPAPRSAAPSSAPEAAPAPAARPADAGATARPDAPAPAPAPAARARLTPEQLAALATREVPGFRRTSQRSGKSNAVVTFEGTTANARGFRPTVQVIVEHCMFCAKLDVAAWRANEHLKRTLSTVHLENPALVFEVDALDLGGRTGIGVYKESFVATKNATGTTRSSAHGLQAWFNDGTHQAMLEVSARGPALPDSLEAVRESMSRAEMEAAARAVFAAFADVF
ncbi:MAG: hypothetical protein JNM10_01860 [Planctomycetia bacterium]|nr:hypothetical protein [Planctomycetia bacterium]